MEYRYEVGCEQNPIFHIAEQIPNSVINIAPEKKDEIVKRTEDLTFLLLNSDKTIAHIDLSKNKISISTGILDALWCYSYAFYVIYVKVFAGLKFEGQTVNFDMPKFENDPDIHDAAKCYVFGSGRWKNENPLPWPDQLIRPIQDPQKESFQDVAREITLGAMAFIVHHEIAHHELQHFGSKGETSIDQERDADYEAGDFILSIDQKEFKQKRGLCVATALLAILTGGLFSNSVGGLTHPRSYERLVNVLNRHFGVNDDLVWAYVASMLILVHNFFTIPIPIDESENFLELTQKMIDSMANEIND